MTRRTLLAQGALIGCGFAVGDAQESLAQTTTGEALPDAQRTPDAVWVFTESGSRQMTRAGDAWTVDDVALLLATNHSGGVGIRVRAERSAVLRFHLRWNGKPANDLIYLGDQWERSYGDLGWRGLDPERILPWYFLAASRRSVMGCGVKTGARAFCFWQVDGAGLSLWMDVRNGGRGVLLGGREVEAATIVTERYPSDRTFAAAAQFCRQLCDRPRLAAKPVYGGNNWYYAYGKSSAEDILRDSDNVASFGSAKDNPAFMVIDDGWTPNATAGPWVPNDKFGDMGELAEKMKSRGVRPGIWIRPLFTKENVPEGWRLPSVATKWAGEKGAALDPTVPEALAKIRGDFERLDGWGYELIKHDFSTYDLLGRWGSQMGAVLTDGGWSFHDRSRTNAEVIRGFYGELRSAAPRALAIGCNTVGHLGAGIFELQRTGDDTSGRDFNRTRKMGVNTLAFRAPQHNAFFAVDADCAGITKDIPWELNRQWLQLLAYSGTALFVSAAPDAIGPDQKKALREAFAYAAAPQTIGEPLDWMETTEPARWRLNGKTVEFDWVGAAGASPFPQ